MVRQMEEAVLVQGDQRQRNKSLLSFQTQTGRLLTQLKSSDFLLTLNKTQLPSISYKTIFK